MYLKMFFRLMCFLNLLFIINCLQVLYETPNVKTALFSELDVRRSCWNHEEINLLRTRMVMQDLIPKKIPRDLPYLLEYIRGTEEAVVQHSPEGKVRKVMMLALADILGGYLQAVAVPMAKEAYYAGNIDYATMARFQDILIEMKSRLKTNGGRWSRPVDMSKFSVKVTSLNLPVENSELACKAIFVVSSENCGAGASRIAIPYLDYDAKPGAVALPLKSRNLYSLKTAASSHIIVRFYILARQCLAGMPSKETDVFNFHFIKWLTEKVVPHLYEDNWYPGFGSVMRIIETVNETEIFQHGRPFFSGNDTSLENVLIHNKACGIVESVKAMAKYNLYWLLFLIITFLFILLICCGCCCWVYKMNNGGFGIFGKKKSSLVNAVLSIYCGLKDKDDSGDRGDRYTFTSSKTRPSYPSGYTKPSGGTYKNSYSKEPYNHIQPSPETSSDEFTSSEDETSKTTN